MESDSKCDNQVKRDDIEADGNDRDTVIEGDRQTEVDEGIRFLDVNRSLGSLFEDEDGSERQKWKWFNDKELDNALLEVGMMFKSWMEFRQAWSIGILQGDMTYIT